MITQKSLCSKYADYYKKKYSFWYKKSLFLFLTVHESYSNRTTGEKLFGVFSRRYSCNGTEKFQNDVVLNSTSTSSHGDGGGTYFCTVSIVKTLVSQREGGQVSIRFGERIPSLIAAFWFKNIIMLYEHETDFRADSRHTKTASE